MFTLRCTQRLLARLKTPLGEARASPTTRLGDWYATLVYLDRRQFVVALSERTFLPVILTAGPTATLVDRIRSGAREVLLALRVDLTAVDREIEDMGSVSIGRTASRQITGIMVDVARLLEFHLPVEPSLLSCSLKLAETPYSPLYGSGNISPDDATRKLFAR